jgi:hypothetical protein
LFIAVGGNCVGAVLGGVVATRYGVPAPYWIGFVVAAVAAATWRIFDRASVAEAYSDAGAEPSLVLDANLDTDLHVDLDAVTAAAS